MKNLKTFFKKVVQNQKPSRACTQQLTKVSSQSDEWYRNTSNTNKQTDIHLYTHVYMDGSFHKF